MTFRGMPALLALLLINILFMCLVIWALWTSADLRFKERSELIRIIDRRLSSGMGKTGTKGTSETGTTTPIGTTTAR